MRAGGRIVPCDDGDVTRRPRIVFRSPGVKPGQRIGPLGPFRGRLGLQWVVAPLVLGIVLVVAGWYFLRDTEPAPPWRPVAEVSSLPIGQGREALPGVLVGRLPDGRVVAVAAEPGCSLGPSGGGYVDCNGTAFRLDGAPVTEGDALDLVPVQVYDGVLYANPEERIER